MTTAASILVVEDEPSIQSLLQDYLENAGHMVTLCANGEQALTLLGSRQRGEAPFDVVILDIMLPGLDGLGVCQSLREFSQVPVVFLTARHEEVDRLLGLRLGADDYVCKPFSPRELVARVNAMIRRMQWHDSKQGDAVNALAYEGVTVDAATFMAKAQGSPLELTPVEFRLLQTLVQQPGRVFRRDQLVQAAYEDYRVVSDRTIDSHIKNLRMKLHKAAPDVDYIHSVYGVGYRFEVAHPAQ